MVGLIAESERSEKSSSRVKPMPSNSRVHRSSASRSSIGNCAGVAGGDEYAVGIFFSTRLFIVANVDRKWIQLPHRHSSRKASKTTPPTAIQRLLVFPPTLHLNTAYACL